MNFAFHCDKPAPANGRKVAIIGAGPSGLAAAGYLACKGYEVHSFDKLPRPGGLMVFGIPGYRIPEGRIRAGVDRLEKRLGVVFHQNYKVCGSAALRDHAGDQFTEEMGSLSELAAEHDAVIICTGSWKSRKLGIPGEELPGVYSGLQYLFPVRALEYAVDPPDLKLVDVEGKNVVVIGAGHSAVDVVHNALARHAKSVRMLYRRTKDDAPAGCHDIEICEESGCHWVELALPVAITGTDKVEGVALKRCSLCSIEGSDRLSPVPIADSDEVIPADVVVTAIGEVPTAPFAEELGLDRVRKGEIHWLQMTRMQGVFVAGDALTGPSKIGKAYYSGLRAARSLDEWFEQGARGPQNGSCAYDPRQDVVDLLTWR